MSAVETWITRNTHWFRRGMKVDHKWGIVRTEEIAVPVGADGRGPQVSYTSAHMLSARFTTHLHRMIGSSSSASWKAKFVASAFAFVTTRLGALRGRSGEDALPKSVPAPCAMKRNENLCRKGSEKKLLQRVHQSGDGAIQIFVRPPHLFDFVDRVQHRGVVLAAELAADFRQ